MNLPHPSPRSASSERPRDHGAGFLELLVSIVLLGTAGIAVLSAVGVAAFGAASQREIAEAQAALSAVNDELTTGAIAFEPCGTVGHYDASVPAHYDVEVTAVQYWEASAWVASCDPATNSLQLLTLLADSADRGNVEREVVIRLPSDPDAEYVVNQGSGSGNGAPIAPISPTPGIDGPTTTTTTAPATTTVPTGPATTAPATTTPTTTPAPTTIPGPAPTCGVTDIDVNKNWKDTITVEVRNQSTHSYDWRSWSVRLGYDGEGAEQNGHYVSTWSGDELTLTPGKDWLTLSPTSSRTITILEPGKTLNGLQPFKVSCEVLTP